MRGGSPDAATLIEWGARIGPSVKWAKEDVLRHTTFPQQAYGRCNGLLSLARKYGQQRLDRACGMQREQSGTASYQSLRNMLKNNMDLDGEPAGIVSRTPYNENVRGAAAYRSVNLKGKPRGAVAEKEEVDIHSQTRSLSAQKCTSLTTGGGLFLTTLISL